MDGFGYNFFIKALLGDMLYQRFYMKSHPYFILFFLFQSFQFS